MKNNGVLLVLCGALFVSSLGIHATESLYKPREVFMLKSYLQEVGMSSKACKLVLAFLRRKEVGKNRQQALVVGESPEDELKGLLATMEGPAICLQGNKLLHNVECFYGRNKAFIAFHDNNRNLYLWDVLSLKVKELLPILNRRNICDVEFSPKGTYLVCKSYRSKEYLIFDLSKSDVAMKSIRIPDENKEYSSIIEFSPNEDFFITVDNSRCFLNNPHSSQEMYPFLFKYDLVTFQVERFLINFGSSRPIKSLRVSCEGDVLVAINHSKFDDNCRLVEESTRLISKHALNGTKQVSYSVPYYYASVGFLPHSRKFTARGYCKKPILVGEVHDTGISASVVDWQESPSSEKRLWVAEGDGNSKNYKNSVHYAVMRCAVYDVTAPSAC